MDAMSETSAERGPAARRELVRRRVLDAGHPQRQAHM